MFTLKIESKLGTVELTHDLNNYAVIGIQGLTPPPTTINTSVAGNIDGSFFNSARVESRNLVITIVLRGDIEGNRQRLYRIFPRKAPVTVYFKNKNRDVKIVGYVDTLEGDLFVQQERIQISILCPRPYWEAIEDITHELSEIQALFEFPFSIAEDDPIEVSSVTENATYIYDNVGDVDTGAVFTFEISGDITGLTLTNSTTGAYIGFNYTFAAGDIITLSTVQGELYARLKRNNSTINLLNYLISGSTWVKLTIGENELKYSVASGNEDDVRCTFVASTLYGGV